MNKSKIRKITVLSILLSLCISISIVDSIISGLVIPFLPGIKIGLSNIIILIVLYKYGFKEGLIVTVLKSVISGLLFSGITAFIIGGTASLVSFFVMFCLKQFGNEKISMVSVSLVGGILHILVQISVVSVIYKLGSVVYTYGLYLFLVSIFTSIVVGVVAMITYDYLNKIGGTKNEKEL